MKILFITNYDSMYGANRCLYEMAVTLKECYNEDVYVLVPGGGEIANRLGEVGIECLCCDFRISAIDGNTKHKRIRKFTRQIMRYKDFINILEYIKNRNIKFDLIHTNTSITDLGLFLSKCLNIPHVWHVREFAKEDYNLEYVWSRKSQLMKYRKSNVVIAISKAIKKRIYELGDNISIRQIYDGVSINERYSKEYFKDGITRFGIVGSISQGKNQMDVVYACEKLIDRGYRNFEVYIVGETAGEYYNQIHDYIVDNEMQRYVKFTGYRNKVCEILKDMDVGIMASTMEGFGRVTIEYMANYMLVIGTNSGGTPELIGENGLIYQTHDIDKLTEYMAMCINDKEIVKIKGEKNRIAAEKFSVESNVKSIHDIYINLLN